MGAGSLPADGLYRGPRASHVRRPGSDYALCGVALAMCEHEPAGVFDGRTCHCCRALFDALPPAHDLTPSEVALSKVLAAWVEWWVAAPSCGPDGDCMSDVGLSLIKRGMVNRNGTTSPAGAALLDRARKAGVL